MAIFDVYGEFSDNQPVFSTNSTVRSTDILNWTAADREMGAGEPLWLNIRVGATSFATGDSCQFIVAGDANGDASFAGAVTIYQTPAIATASLTAGTWVLRMPLPVNVDDNQYLGIQYTCVGAMDAGTVDAWIDHGPQSSFDTQVATSNI